MGRFFILSGLLIGISSILQWLDLPLNNTLIWWSIYVLILYAFIKFRQRISASAIKIFIVWLSISAVYGGMYMTENYWDWKLLVSNYMSMMLLVGTYTFSSPTTLSPFLRTWFRYGWIIFIVLCPFMGSDAFGRYLVPYAFLSLFLSIIQDKKNILLIFIALVLTIIFGYEDRSSTIKFVFYLLIGISLIYWHVWRKISDKLFKALHVIFLSLPFLFTVLGISGIFNVFQIKEELNLEPASVDDVRLVDTRTFLYVEEIESAIDHDYVICGRSIARGYDSLTFGGTIDQMLGVNRGERGACEVCILNIFNYMGVIGVILYFFIFLQASYLAIYKSNNQYVKIVGVYITFRWMYAFIHDGIEFNLNFLFIVIGLAICYSPQFRHMTALEFKHFINNSIK